MPSSLPPNLRSGRDGTQRHDREVAEMAQTLAPRHTHAGPSLWLLAFSTVVLASGALLIILWSPKALALALLVGAGAVVARTVFYRIKVATGVRAEASSVVANAGLALAAVAIAPLLAFALLWTALLVFLGATWVLHAIGVI